MARDALIRAVALAPDDPAVRAMLRYCEGHLHRINGEAQKGRDDLDGARRDLTNAVVAFRQAAELRERWPDPYIGLLRTFVVGLEDVDNAADALEKAQQNGYKPVERDFVQLADGYRARGNSLVRSARQVAGLPQERDYLVRAVEAYQLALDLYSKAGGFGNTPQLVARTQRTLLQVEESLGELVPPVVRELAPPGSGEASSSVPEGGAAVFQGTAPWQ
jgi:hypothetical protein